MPDARSTKPVIAMAAIAALAFTPLAIPAPAYRDIAVPSISASPCPQARPAQQIAIQLAAATTDLALAGVADSDLYNLDQADLTSRLEELRSLGVTDLRVAVPWVYIQPTSGTYDWARMDNVVQTATAMGFNLTGAITGNPVWGGMPLAGAPNPTAYGKFAGEVATRYGTQISSYEIWNEPNGVIFYAPVSAASYTKVLQAGYAAIKAAQPNATVLAGALGATGTIPGVTLSPQQFLAQMYEAGAAGYFDALSYHPYNYSLPFSTGAGINNSPLEQVAALYALMVANGDAHKKIWATEYGTPTTPGWGVTQTEQAALLRDFVTAWSRLSFAGPAFVYSAQDLNTGILNHEFNFGLFTSEGKPKLAAQVLAELIAAGALGELPEYTAPRMSMARDVYLQLASIGFGLANQAMLIPHLAVAAVYNMMPAPVQRAFSTVAALVSRVAAEAMTAIAPAAQSGIESLLRMIPNANTAEPAAESAALQSETPLTPTSPGDAGDSIAENLHNTRLTLQGHLRDTQLTLEGALRGTQITIERLGQLANGEQSATSDPAAQSEAAGTVDPPESVPETGPETVVSEPTTDLEPELHPGAVDDVESPSAESEGDTTASAPSAGSATSTADADTPEATIGNRTSPKVSPRLSADATTPPSRRPTVSSAPAGTETPSPHTNSAQASTTPAGASAPAASGDTDTSNPTRSTSSTGAKTSEAAA
ncbi:cellulase family glycosylhydrolase [Mycobacterium adipatum]|uniref:cellulase family glycosylhydrolase n=1 Tax=Mycobacterium adipatum TaxID=1682113 RepID=UPI0034E06639